MIVILWIVWSICTLQLCVNLIRDHRDRNRAEKATSRRLVARYREDRTR